MRHAGAAVSRLAKKNRSEIARGIMRMVARWVARRDGRLTEKGVRMSYRKACLRVAGGIVLIMTSLAAFQRPFREFPGREYNDFPIPKDWQTNGEWTFARLMYQIGR